MPAVASEIRWVLDRPGRSPLDLTPYLLVDRWSTLAVGGFGSLAARLPGDARRWKREIPHLSILTGTFGPRVIFQGQVEDVGFDFTERDGITARIQAFGLARKLDETSVRKQWLTRSVAPWTVIVQESADVAFSQGQVDSTDSTKVAARFTYANGATLTFPNVDANARTLAASGLYWKQIKGTRRSTMVAAGTYGLQIRNAGGSVEAIFTVNGSEGATDFSYTATIDDGNEIRFFVTTNGASNYVATTDNLAEVYALRLLGWAQTEDTSGAFYGGTILRDLIGLVPGLTIGVVEDGSDFGIQQIEAAARRAARQVVDEIAGYYSREWAVWEDGRFDWKTPALGEPQWLTSLGDLSGLSIDGTVDGLAKTTYVLYTDAATQTDAEQSSTSGDQRNAYVKTGGTRDRLVSAGFPMTSASASQLASKYAGEGGQWPQVRGSITLPADRLVRHAIEGAQPAWAIRAGDNIVVSDLPRSEAMNPGRDGDTLFHIVSADVELGKRRVTLGVEAQTPRMDQLLARLASVTRAVTG